MAAEKARAATLEKRKVDAKAAVGKMVQVQSVGSAAQGGTIQGTIQKWRRGKVDQYEIDPDARNHVTYDDGSDAWLDFSLQRYVEGRYRVIQGAR